MKSVKEIEEYLHQHIPLTSAMQIGVELVQPEKVQLTAPFEPNINHRNTIFGGSASTLAITSGWSLVHFRLQNEGFNCRVVIQKNSMTYDKPILGDFRALCELTDDKSWKKFTTILAAKGKARIKLESNLLYDDEVVGSFKGDFVAIAL